MANTAGEGRGGRGKYVVSTEKIAAEMRLNRGIVKFVAEACECSTSTIRNRINKVAKLRKIFDECRECVKDHAEHNLFLAVEKGEPWAVCFFLKTQARDRGYSERLNAVKQFGGEAMAQTIVDLVKRSETRKKKKATANGNGRS